MGLGNLIIKADNIGLEPTFTFQSHKRYKTLIGGILSIFLYFLFIGGMLYFGRDLYERSSPMLVSSSSLNPKAAPLALTPTNFPFYIALEDSANNLNYFKDNTIYTMQTFLRTQKRVKDANGLVTLQVQSIPITMVNCDLNYHFEGLQDKYNSTTYQLAYCIAPEQNVTIQGDFPDDQFNFLQVNFYQCTNTTTVTNCKPQSVIDKSIRNTYVTINYGFYLMRPNDFQSPMERIKQEYFTTVSNVGFKQINVYLKRILFSTDSGIVFEDKQLDTYNQIDRIQELATNVIPNPGERLFNIGIRMSYSEDSVFRSYLKLQTVIANVGGLFKFFSMVFEMAVILLTRNSYYLELINENFRINDTKPFHEEPKNDGAEPSQIYDAHVHKNLESNIKIIQESKMGRTMKARDFHDLGYLNEKVKQLKQGNKLSMSICDFVKTFYCRLDNIRIKKYRHVFNKGVKVIKKCIDINEVISKLLEYERFKQIMLDKEQLVFFNASPVPNIEAFGMNTGDRTFMSTFYGDVYSYQRLQQSFLKVTESQDAYSKRLLGLYDPNVLDFLNKL
jgi:hypothetical protein